MSSVMALHPSPRPNVSGMRPTRRALLVGSASVASALALASVLRREREATGGAAPVPSPSAAPDVAPRFLSPHAFATLEAVQARLLPSVDGSPSAEDVGAARYVDAVLARGELDPPVSEAIVRGLADLDDVARAAGFADFLAQTDVARDASILALWSRGERGEAFYDQVLAVTLEALLGDPSHGGNPAGIAWRWLGLAPGAPR